MWLCKKIEVSIGPHTLQFQASVMSVEAWQRGGREAVNANRPVHRPIHRLKLKKLRCVADNEASIDLHL